MAKLEFPAGERTRQPTHPGKIIGRGLKAMKRTVNKAAGEMEITQQSLANVVACKSAVSPDMAQHIGAYFGNGPDLWLRLQADYDLYRSAKTFKTKLARVAARGKTARQDSGA